MRLSLAVLLATLVAAFSLGAEELAVASSGRLVLLHEGGSWASPPLEDSLTREADGSLSLSRISGSLISLDLGRKLNAKILGLLASKSSDILVGLVAPHSGDFAGIGQSAANGSRLAVEERNAAGGLLGKRVILLIEDDKGEALAGGESVAVLAQVDKVAAIVGPVFSSTALAAAPQAQAAKVPMISPGATNPKVTKAGDYIFRACFADPDQGAIGANFAYGTLKARRAAVIYDANNEYSAGMAETFKARFKELGGELAAYESHEAGAVNFRPQLARIVKAKPDLLFVPEFMNEAALIAKQARELGYTGQLLGGDGWEGPDFASLGGAAVENAFFITQYAEDSSLHAAREFQARYQARFGVRPDAIAVLGFEAMLLTLDAIARAGSTNGSAIRDALAATDLRTPFGPIRFDASRNPIKPATILQIRRGKPVFHSIVEPEARKTATARSSTFSVGLVTDQGGINDGSFNQAVWQGLRRFASENGLSEGKNVSYVESANSDELAGNFRSMVERKTELIVGPGFLMAEPMRNAAIFFPENRFLILDSVIQDSNGKNLPNVASAVFAEHEGAYLVGVAAGLKAKAEGRRVLGFIGGMRFPLIEKFQAGFEQGVRAVYPEARVLVDYAGDFVAPEKGQALAKKQYGAGAYVIFQAAGYTGMGVFKEARERAAKGDLRWVVGVDKDQYSDGIYADGKSVTLSSMMKRVDTAAYEVAKMTLGGGFPGGQVLVFGVAKGGLSLPERNPNLSPEILAAVASYAEKISSGAVKVAETPQR